MVMSLLVALFVPLAATDIRANLELNGDTNMNCTRDWPHADSIPHRDRKEEQSDDHSKHNPTAKVHYGEKPARRTENMGAAHHGGDMPRRVNGLLAPVIDSDRQKFKCCKSLQTVARITIQRS